MPPVSSQISERYADYITELAPLIGKNTDENTQILVNQLYTYLCQASEIENLLAMQYLYSAFSLKKYPEEFNDYPSQDPKVNDKILAQIEVIRRWEANLLYVSRQEMEHLNLVQNMIVILGKSPYLYRPNFPIPADQSLLGKPINLMPFSQHAIEIFRYWEKPDHLDLPDPFLGDDVPRGIKNMADKNTLTPNAEPHDQESIRQRAFESIILLLNGSDVDVKIDSIEILYEYIWVYFAVLFEFRLLNGQNFTNVSEEHFGFNLTLDTLIDGQYFSYVDQVITQILEEGEGVWGVPPPLDSHFTVYQNMLDEIVAQKGKSTPAIFSPALPVVWNPTISSVSEHHSVELPATDEFDADAHAVTPITNPISIKAMNLFNIGNGVLIRMLHGYFNLYEIDQTTGIRPKEVNAFFRTSFYPFMTMVIRPLGEILCRLPADANYTPVDGKVPDKTAGPNFFYDIHQAASLEDRLALTSDYGDGKPYIDEFAKMRQLAHELSEECLANGYHTANYKEKDARDFPDRFQYLCENLERISKNFEAYWEGKMIAPIPSIGFQNFNNTFN